MKKRNIFCILICLTALILCFRPLPLNAQSGSSTCQVTATAGEKESSPPGDMGDGKEESSEPGTTTEPEARPTEKPGEPGTGEAETEPSKEPGKQEEEGTDPEGEVTTQKPGETGQTPEPEVGKTPGAEEEQEPDGDSGQESQKSEDPPAPGEETTSLDKGGDMPGEESGPVGTGEPVPEGHDEYSSIICWLLVGMLLLCIFAALLAGGILGWLWMLFCFMLFKRSRIRFHGILTDKKSFFVRIKNAEESSGLVQGMIDSAGSFAEFKKEVLQETAFTSIPRQSRMRISCTGRNGRKRDGEMEASERRLFRILERLEGTGEVEVRITCRGTGIDILLVFRV